MLAAKKAGIEEFEYTNNDGVTNTYCREIKRVKQFGGGYRDMAFYSKC